MKYIYYCQNLQEHNPKAPVKVEYGDSCPQCHRMIDWTKTEEYGASTVAVYPIGKDFKIL